MYALLKRNPFSIKDRRLMKNKKTDTAKRMLAIIISFIICYLVKFKFID